MLSYKFIIQSGANSMSRVILKVILLGVPPTTYKLWCGGAVFFLKQEKATDSVGGSKFQGFSFKHRANWYFDKVIYKISEINWM